MNGSTKAACALVACETEFFVRGLGQALEGRQIGRVLRQLAIWVVPPTRCRARPQRLIWPWHILLSIAAAAAVIGVGQAPGFAQCCGMGAPSYAPCGSCCGSPSFCGSPCGGCGSCGMPSCGMPMPCGAPMCGCAPPCGCRPSGCCSGGCGCRFPRFSLFPGSSCCPNCAPACGSPCGPACGLACGPCYGSPCGAPACGCGPSCGGPGMPGPCGGACGCPTPTFETPGVPQPSSSNKPGPTTIEPADTPPTGPPAPIKQRPGAAPEGSKFERQPQGSLDTADGLNSSQASAEASGLIEKRLFRQCASAGFHTRVLVPGSEQLLSQADGARNTASADFVLPHAVARTD
jgi:hypothetical protein